MKTTKSVLEEVYQERERQHAKWGEQNLPNIDQELLDNDWLPDRVAWFYEIPTAAEAKQRYEEDFARDEGSWAHVAVEELAEAIEAASLKDKWELRKELIQCAAVFVAWVEALDRRE